MELKKDSPVRAALIGTGNMARHWATAFKYHPSFVLSGLYSRSKHVREQFAREHGVASTSSSIAALAEESGARVLVIAVSELNFPEVFSQAAKYDWEILAEKPVGIDLETARAMSQLAATRTSGSYSAFNRRYFKSVASLKSALELSHGSTFFRVTDQHMPSVALLGGKPRQVVDNWMFANAIHMVDLIRFIGRGVPKVVSTATRKVGDGYVVEASISFDTGDSASYFSLWEVPGGWSIECFTGDKLMELRPLEELRHYQPAEKEWIGACTSYLSPELKPGLMEMLDALLGALEGKETTLPTFDDSLQSMALVSQIFNTEGNRS